MRKPPWIGAAAVLVLASSLHHWRGAPEPERSGPLPATAGLPSPGTSEAGPQSGGGILLRATASARPLAGSARCSVAVAQGKLATDDAVAPSVVEQWLPAQAEVLPNGDLRLQCPPGPPGLTQRVVASGGGLFYYHGRVPGEGRGLVLDPQPAGALRLLNERLPEQARIELRWDPAPPDEEGSDVVDALAPELATAFRSEPSTVAPDARWLPLPPGSRIRARLWIGAVAADQRSLLIEPGRDTELRFDAARIAAAATRSGSLSLSLLGQDRQPLTGLRVVYAGPEAMEQATSNGAGEVRFAAIDLQAPLQFELYAEAGSAAAATQPEFQKLLLAPADLRPVSAGQWAAEALLASQRWLRIDVSPLARIQQRPYPVFVLQREHAGSWEDMSEAEFHQEGSVMRVSARESGRYRLRVAASPWHWLDSAELDLAERAPSETRAAVAWSDAPTAQLRLLREGAVLAGEPIRVRGDQRAFPPLEGETDANGYFALGMVSRTDAWIAIGDREWQVKLRPGTLTLDLAAAIFE